MKILQVCNKFPYPDRDGGAIATMAFTREFSKQGHEVTVAAINTSKHHFDYHKLPEDVKSIADFRKADVNTDVSPLKLILNFLFSNKPYNAIRFVNEDFRELLIRVLKEKQFDVVQLEGLYLCPYIDIIRKYSKALISLRAHNVELEIWERIYLNEKNRLKKWYFKNLASRLSHFETSYLNKYDVIVPITERDAKRFDVLGNKKPTFAAPMGINPFDLDLKMEDELENSIFHLGGLDWPPNQEGLIWFLENVWPELLKKIPNLIFYIAGRNAPENLINKFFEYDNIIFHGEIAKAQKYMISKGIMVVPLLSGSGMRVKIIEGMGLGKIIVSTPIGAEGIKAINNEHIIIADKPEEFISSIEFYLKNKDKANSIRKNAVKLVNEEYNITKITTNLAEFYEKHMRQ